MAGGMGNNNPIAFVREWEPFRDKLARLSAITKRALPPLAFHPTAKLRILRRNFVRCLDHFVHELFEFCKPGRGDDNGVAPAADVLSDAKEPPARIFLE